MTRHAPYLAVLLSPLLLVAACSSGPRHTTRLLDDRLQARLAPDIEAGNAAFKTLPDGAQVTLLGPSMFADDVRSKDDKTRDVRASVVEGLLDPALMRIEVADTSASPDDRRAARVQNVQRYLTDFGLGATIQPAVQTPGDPVGLTISVHVQCTSRTGGSGYGDGTSKPICD